MDTTGEQNHVRMCGNRIFIGIKILDTLKARHSFIAYTRRFKATLFFFIRIVEKIYTSMPV